MIIKSTGFLSRRRQLSIVIALAALTLSFPLAASAIPVEGGDTSSAAVGAHLLPGSAPAAKPAPSDVTPAQARTFINMGSRPGAGIHTCASNQCSVTGWAVIGDALYDTCYVTGQNLEGNIFWDRVQNVRTGALGWTNENWLWDQTQTRAC